jgi:hypothetical protein
MSSYINGLPGVFSNTGQAQPRKFFWSDSDKAKYVAGPCTLDMTGGNGQNQPYNWILFSGMPLGIITSTTNGGSVGNFAPSIIGTVQNAYTSGGTSLTIDTGGATELNRLIGGNGTFTLTSAPSANGAVASVVQTSVTYSAVNTSTGVITVTNIGANVIAGSWIGAPDGRATIKTLLADDYNQSLYDLWSNRLSVFCSKIWNGGGVVDTGNIWPAYPTDTGLQAYLKAQIRNNIPEALFNTDLLTQ